MYDITSGVSLQWNLTGVVVAGSNSSGSDPNELDQPGFLYIDASGALFICDSGNNRIQKWISGAPNGTTVAGNSNGNNGDSSSLLHNPTGIDFDSNGYMYIADSNNNRVQRYPPNSTNGTTVAGIGGNGTANNQLRQPIAVNVDENLNIFITDTGNRRVVMWALNATTGIILIDAGGSGAANGQLDVPYGILLIDGSLNQVYLSDLNRHHVQMWTFGAANANTTFSTAISTNLDHPTQMMLDPNGNLYVADMNNKRVVMFYANSTTGIVIVGTGTTSTPTLQSPSGIAFDSNFNLYVSDSNLNQVLKYARL
ncbi:unnamed protein product [Sphagnum troendelagicum]|uniref:NHL repeat-containing protein n=1 Tax=Sphagnum troendelagicum TaxID=128251 RepID=A0ABP0T756_9BRYO